jgi:predicted tellurium resistance membrane protein TerC
VAVKLVTEESDGEGGVESAENLWRAVRIVAIADIVMSLDNVIAIAASAEVAAAKVDLAHAAGIKTTLIIFGLATSVPLIIAGSAVLMALLERFRILVWAGGALLGWVAGDIMSTDPALKPYFDEHALHQLHVWGGRLGALLVLLIGLYVVRKHRPLVLDEKLAFGCLLVWIAGDVVLENVIGVADGDVWKVWVARVVILAGLTMAYVVARNRNNGSVEAAAMGVGHAEKDKA